MIKFPADSAIGSYGQQLSVAMLAGFVSNGPRRMRPDASQRLSEVDNVQQSSPLDAARPFGPKSRRCQTVDIMIRRAASWYIDG